MKTKVVVWAKGVWMQPWFMPGWALGQVLMVGVLVQFLLLPVFFPAWHNGAGILEGHDATRFHPVAVDLLDRMREGGLGAWEFRPEKEGVSGLIVWFYFFLVPQPWVILPLNGLCFAGSVFLVERISRRITGSFVAARLAAGCFCLFPSSALWYAQIHREVLFVPGMLLQVWALVALFEGKKPVGRVVGCFVVGWFLVWWMRPHVMPVIALANLVGAGVFLLSLRWEWRNLWWLGMALLMVVGPLLWPRQSFFTYEKRVTALKEEAVVKGPLEGVADEGFRWWEVIPASEEVQKQVEAIDYNRVHLLDELAGAGSNVDEDVRFNHLGDVVNYLPRALALGWLAPFPDMWFGEARSPGGGIFRRLVAGEMVLGYFGLLGVGWLFVFRREKRWLLLGLLGFSTIFLLVWTLSVPNVGSLYRYRFAIWMCLVSPGLGVLGEMAWRRWRNYSSP